jgi:uncharacterized protein
MKGVLMKEVNKTLQELALLDHSSARLKRRLQEKPLALRNDQIKLEQTKADLAALEQQLKDHDLKGRSMDKDCQIAESELKKSLILQNAASTNEEYQAHQRKIEGLQAGISVFETNILEGMEQREIFDERVKKQKAVVSTAENVLKNSESKIAEEISGIQSELDTVLQSRTQCIGIMETDDRLKYDRVYQKHGANTLVQILDRICQGCYVSMRPNDLIRVESGREIVHCGDCGKILYLR